MLTKRLNWRRTAGAVASIALCAAVVGAAPAASSASAGGSTARYIVSDVNGLVGALGDVLAVGGQVLEDLGVADAVLATLNPVEVLLLDLLPGVVLTPDVTVSVQSTGSSAPSRAPAAVFPEETGATQLWGKGDTGAGVNVAVLDTGIDPLPDLSGRLVGGVDLSGGGNAFSDQYGHGTFVAGLIASDGASSRDAYMGEAPGAGLVSVKVAGSNGDTDLATVIDGVGWAVSHARSMHIGVLNMSLGYQPFTSTSVNPLDMAVEKAWNAGIVVVTSAGNAGPFDGTILSPGDDPLVITVGALDDLGTTNPSDDTMPSFSSVGPTNPNGYFKPDLVASGRSVVSLRAPGSTVDTQNPLARIGSSNFVGTGTSFSTAITSGAAALVLAAHPTDTPNGVKAALLASTSPGPVGNPFVDGHGALNVVAAVAKSGVRLQQSYGRGSTGTANLGSSWAESSWNPSNWSGLSSVASTAPLPGLSGLAWSGSSWNGSAWDHLAWNGSAWDHLAWNGSSWTGSAWDHLAWNGSAWNGSAWDHLAWNGSEWN